MRVFVLTSLVAVLGVGIAFAPATSSALEKNPECVLDARDDYKDCKFDCRELFRSEKDLCRNVDHECADNCRQGRQACLWGDPDDPNDLGPMGEREGCKAECKATLQAGKDDCRAQDFADPNSPAYDPVALDECIDAHQVVAFQCRDQCREGTRAQIRACRAGAKACILACPPAP